MAMLQNGRTCSCYDPSFNPSFTSGMSSSVQCTATSDWQVFGVSNLNSNPVLKLGFDVDVIYPTDKGYTMPLEEIVFEFIFKPAGELTGSTEKVIVKADMGDGEKKATPDMLTSHSWKQAGLYTVKFTAVHRLVSENKTIMINITQVDEGTGPEHIRVKGSPTNESLTTEFYLSIISRTSIDCTLDFGDGNTKEFKALDEFVNAPKVNHTYVTAGYYETHLFCDNGYGTGEARAMVVAQNRKVGYVTKVFGSDIVIPIIGAGNHPDRFEALVDGKVVNPTIDEKTVTFPGSMFKNPGQHLIQIKASWFVLHQHIANVQNPIEGIKIEIENPHATGDEMISISFLIFGGDRIHLRIIYGDGYEEMVFYPKGGSPLRVIKKHSYKKTGYYNVIIVAANDVGFKKAEKMVSSEKGIESVAVSVANVTELGKPARFEFDVDTEMPFEAVIDFDNGHTETAKLVPNKEALGKVVYDYVYPDYGIYYFSMIVQNNISGVPIKGMLQVKARG